MRLCRLCSFTASNMFTPSHMLLKHWSAYAEVMPDALIKEAQADVTKPNITGYKLFTAPICHTYVASVNTYQHWGYCTGRCKTSFIIYTCVNVATKLPVIHIRVLVCSFTYLHYKIWILGITYLIPVKKKILFFFFKNPMKCRNSPILDVCCCCCASLQKKLSAGYSI